MRTTNTHTEILEEVEAKFGFVPNLLREMARSPAVARAYLDAQAAMEKAILSNPERQVVQLAVAVYNDCHYCRAVHRTACARAGVPAAEVEAIEKGSLPEDARRRSLVSATWQVLDTRGWLVAPDLAALEAEGVPRAQVYEVVALIGLKVISNYINHVAHTPIDQAFQK